MTNDREQIEQRLETRLQELQNQLASRKKTLEHVQELLERADQRCAEADNKRRWYHVLDNLEHALDEAKARVAQSDQEIKQLKRKLDGLAQQHSDDADAEPMVEDKLIALQASGVNVGGSTDADSSQIDLPKVSPQGAEKVLSIPLDELSGMSLDEVADLHNEILQKEDARNGADAESSRAGATPDEHHPRGRHRVGNESRQTLSFHEQRRQSVLRNAVDKIRSERLDALTIEEIDLVTDLYERFSKRLEANKSDERLRSILGGTLEKLSDRISELRRRRARLYARRHR